MKLAKKFCVFIFSALLLGSLMIPLQGVKAYSPIIASCSNGVLDDDNFFSVGGRAVFQLFEVRLDDYYLDAVSVRLLSGLGTDSAVVSIIKRDGPTIATSAAQPVTTTASWIYFDLPNVPLPRGVYLLSVIGASPEVVAWNKGPGTCIDDSYVIIDGERRQDYDMAFAIYAYDSSQTDNGSQPAANDDQAVTDNSDSSDQNTGDTSTSGDLPPGSSGTSSSSGSSGSLSNNPSKEDILKMSGNSSEGTGFLEGLLLSGMSPIVSIFIFFFGFIIFVGVIILVIWLVVRRKRKPEPKKESAEQDKEKTDKEEKPKKEEKV